MTAVDIEASPVEMFVNALLLAAADRDATHVRAIAGGSVEFFIDSVWEHQVSTPDPLHTPIVRRLGVMIGVLPPRRGEPRFGRVVLSRGERSLFFLVAIDRGEELSALVELVDEATFHAGRQPRPPSPHPYRSDNTPHPGAGRVG